MCKTKSSSLIWIAVAWVLLLLVNYYYTPYYILAFEWLGMCITFLVICIVQVVKLLTKRRSISAFRLQKLILFILLLCLTFFHTADRFIERFDWKIMLHSREKIVAQVKNGALRPNVSWNGWICQLPFRFPPVSNGGNDIGIYRNTEQNTMSVTFWIFRNYFEAPSTQFIYTDDAGEMERIEQKIHDKPLDNWKIQANWYRTKGD